MPNLFEIMRNLSLRSSISRTQSAGPNFPEFRSARSSPSLNTGSVRPHSEPPTLPSVRVISQLTLFEHSLERFRTALLSVTALLPPQKLLERHSVYRVTT